MKQLLILPLLIVALCFGFFNVTDADTASRGVQVVIKDAQGHQVALYKGSYALLIGASRYTAGWPGLATVPGEIETVRSALEKQGFVVEMVSDPDSEVLRSAFIEFINRYGLDPNNRLLFFYAGHGYTRREGRRGYLVPVDAPDPRANERGFVQKALDMDQIMTWARRIESRHALFVFDSCFSGTIFASRDLPGIPPHISDVTARPVRQFITAGDANQPVPAASVFTPSFVWALEGAADLDGDGYITGTELGMFLHRQVLHYQTGQTPQYGKIRDPDLDKGDFVFQVAGSRPIAAHPPAAAESSAAGVSVMEQRDRRAAASAPVVIAPFVQKHARYTKLGEGGLELPDGTAQADGWIMTRDNDTGLIWENKTHANKDTKYIWLDATESFIKRMNREQFGGFRDWRLPGKLELHSLIQDGGKQAADPFWFPHTVNSEYWSSEKHTFYTDKALYVYERTFRILYDDMRHSYHIRAVRSAR